MLRRIGGPLVSQASGQAGKQSSFNTECSELPEFAEIEKWRFARS
ncbi:MAG: hypothetical protein JWQ55_5496, partial [Rhodopila sp.]|nr:hypothetical protein [Rhodopila sp.]